MGDSRGGFDRFRGLDGVRIVHGTASSLHPESRRVSITLADGTTTTEKYDVLVIAAGVTNGFWREPSLQTSDGVSDVLARAHARLADAAEVDRKRGVEGKRGGVRGDLGGGGDI